DRGGSDGRSGRGDNGPERAGWRPAPPDLILRGGRGDVSPTPLSARPGLTTAPGGCQPYGRTGGSIEKARTRVMTQPISAYMAMAIRTFGSKTKSPCCGTGKMPLKGQTNGSVTAYRNWTNSAALRAAAAWKTKR